MTDDIDVNDNPAAPAPGVATVGPIATDVVQVHEQVDDTLQRHHRGPPRRRA